DALARAEQGAKPPPLNQAAAATVAQDPPGATGPGTADPGEWSPMNPRGAAAAPATSGAAGAAGAAGSDPLSGGPPAGPDAADAQLAGAAGGFAEGSPHMNPEELLQLKRERLAMGLEPDAMPAQDLLADGAVDIGDALAARAPGCLAQPVSLLQPMGVGVHSLPESERPVVEGMALGELVLERREISDRADE